jgi:phosphatidate cytidylyltransferase
VKELLKRTLTGITLVLLFLGSIWLGPSPFLAMVLLIYTLGTMELFKVFSVQEPAWRITIAVAGAVLIASVYAGLRFHITPLWLLLSVLLWIPGYLFLGQRPVAVLSFFWLAIPFSSFFALGWLPDSLSYRPLIPLSVISLVWINDTFAYLTGSLLGKHPMTPRLSPRKTWEGFSGGVLVTLLGGWIIYKISGSYSPVIWIACALVSSLLGLAGDLFESGLKRKMNVKDMSGLLPGHGGILDRFDSLLFVAPALLLLFFIQIVLQ